MRHLLARLKKRTPENKRGRNRRHPVCSPPRSGRRSRSRNRRRCELPTLRPLLRRETDADFSTSVSPANGTSPNDLKHLRVKALARAMAGTIYAATHGGGVFKTADGGSNWTACATANMTNLNVISLALDAGGKLYAGTEAGVFVSTDSCATWTAMSNGLPN
jgi:hypothetical protein